jgi:hypothetical protein
MTLTNLNLTKIPLTTASVSKIFSSLTLNSSLQALKIEDILLSEEEIENDEVLEEFEKNCERHIFNNGTLKHISVTYQGIGGGLILNCSAICERNRWNLDQKAISLLTMALQRLSNQNMLIQKRIEYPLDPSLSIN